MASDLRIAMLAPSPDVRSPIPKHTRYLVASLENDGCAVVVVTWGRASDEQGAASRGFDRIRKVFAIRRLLRDGDYDVLVVKTAHDWATLARDLLLLAVCRVRPTTIVQFHGSASDRLQGRGDFAFRSASRLLASGADGIMVLSSGEQQAWSAISGSVPVQVVCNPYRRSAESLSREPRPPGGPRLLFAGRLLEEKGAAELLTAAAELHDLNPEVIIAGDGPDRHRLEGLAAELGVRTRFLGYIDASGMSEAYRSADMFVLPTRWHEGFPTVISEAMDFGLPIVTTRIRGMIDHLQDDVNAILIEPGSHGQLVAAISRLWQDEELRASMSSANREAVAKFEPDAVAADYLRVIRDVLVQGRRAPRR